MSKLNLNPQEETKKLLLRLITAAYGDRIPEDELEATLETCTQDLQLIWSGSDTGARWSIGTGELRQGLKDDPDFNVGEDGKLELK